jgi:hypothetical protein
MSDYYLFHFDFGLDPYLPERAAEVFQSLARSEAPAKDDLAVLPEPLRDFLAHPAALVGGAEGMSGEAPLHPVCLTHESQVPETPYHARFPEWSVSFRCSLHDDWYGNGGFILPMAMMEIVAGNGLFATECEASSRDAVTHYYREHDDLLVVRMDAPFSCAPVPPLSGKSVSEFYPSFRPATQKDFKVSSFTRLTPSDRQDAYAHAKAMLDDLMAE